MKEFKTKQRELILEIINNSHTPLTATQIHQQLQAYNINLTTVYRNLEKFVKDELIVKTHIDKSDYYFKSTTHKHLIVCNECHKMESVPCHIDETIHKELDKLDFEVDSHDLIFYGTCKHCRKNK